MLQMMFINFCSLLSYLDRREEKYTLRLIHALSLGTDLKISGQRRFLMYSQLTINLEIIITFAFNVPLEFVVCWDGSPK